MIEFRGIQIDLKDPLGRIKDADDPDFIWAVLHLKIYDPEMQTEPTFKLPVALNNDPARSLGDLRADALRKVADHLGDIAALISSSNYNDLASEEERQASAEFNLSPPTAE